jgi:hypothetical protein
MTVSLTGDLQKNHYTHPPLAESSSHSRMLAMLACSCQIEIQLNNKALDKRKKKTGTLHVYHKTILPQTNTDNDSGRSVQKVFYLCQLEQVAAVLSKLKCRF